MRNRVFLKTPIPIKSKTFQISRIGNETIFSTSSSLISLVNAFLISSDAHLCRCAKLLGIYARDKRIDRICPYKLFNSLLFAVSCLLSFAVSNCCSIERICLYTLSFLFKLFKISANCVSGIPALSTQNSPIRSTFFRQEYCGTVC